MLINHLTPGALIQSVSKVRSVSVQDHYILVLDALNTVHVISADTLNPAYPAVSLNLAEDEYNCQAIRAFTLLE